MKDILVLKELTKSFHGLCALRDVDITLPRGRVVGLIGLNGAGKTTLFNLVSGIFPPSRGQIFFNGSRIDGLKSHQIASLGILRTFQTPKLFGGMTVLETVMVGLHSKTATSFLDAALGLKRARKENRETREEAERCLAFMGWSGRLEEKASSLPFGKQRFLEITRAFAAKPQLLLMDEPAAGMNSVETDMLNGVIRRIVREGVSIFIIEHDMRLVMNLCDYIFVLNYGQKIAEGIPVEIQGNPVVVQAYLGRPKERRHA